MQVDVSTLIAVAFPTVGALAWLFRLEGRVNTQAALLDRMGADLSYLRRRFDEEFGKR
jgi:hypothetical protein